MAFVVLSLSRSNRKVKVAGIQISCEIGNKAANIDKAVRMIDEASANGCQIICLQELFNTEYVCFTKRDPRYLEYAEPIPGPTTERIASRAEKHGVYIIAPIFEKAAPGLYYNTAALIGPDGGIVGKYRKTHIPAALMSGVGPSLEKLYFRPGYEFKVFETELAKIGIIICWDRWFPETWRILRLDGAEIIFNPSAISIGTPSGHVGGRELWMMSNVTHAYEMGVFVVAINRVGIEEEHQCYGTTMIVNPYGDVLAQGGQAENEVVSAILDLNEVGRSGIPFRDYKPELYDRITRPPKG